MFGRGISIYDADLIGASCARLKASKDGESVEITDIRTRDLYVVYAHILSRKLYNNRRARGYFRQLTL